MKVADRRTGGPADREPSRGILFGAGVDALSARPPVRPSAFS